MIIKAFLDIDLSFRRKGSLKMFLEFTGASFSSVEVLLAGPLEIHWTIEDRLRTTLGSGLLRPETDH